ncbi:MAG: hypothetical protein M3P51_04260 [Chloroflexota bacterium]|nr:hypothetical protein [Chloroflexota bacterium]
MATLTGWDALRDGPAKAELQADYEALRAAEKAERRARLEDERSAALAREMTVWEGIVSAPSHTSQEVH